MTKIFTEAGQLYYDAFMNAMRPFPVHVVTRCVNFQTPGINWSRCSKGHIAESYANAHAPKTITHHPNMAKLNLEQLVADCTTKRKSR